VVNAGGDTVSVIDTVINQVTANISANSELFTVAISPDGTKVYMPTNQNTVSVIDTATNQVTATVVSVGGDPTYVAITPDGTKVYVANYIGNTVSVIDTATNQVTATVSVGDEPKSIVIATIPTSSSTTVGTTSGTTA
jgi:YVTN family beta-propeller protein